MDRRRAETVGGFFLALALGLTARRMLRRRREADLRGQVALITGGSRGLGFLLAREFARQGCRIAICARNGQELDRAREDLERRGAEVLAVSCDVSLRSHVDAMVDQVKAHFGRIDLLVNNAGIMQVGPVQDMTVEDFQRAHGVMFWGVLYPTLSVLPQMLARRSGRIVNITSLGGKVSVPHLLPYNSAKFAAVGLSEGLGGELAREGITVTTVVPGLMRTGSHLNAYFKGQREREFTWFALGASLPLASIDAEQAAREIVQAVRRGESEVILTLPANLLVRAHGLFPGIAVNVLALANRLILPKPKAAGAPEERGERVQERMGSRVLSALTSKGISAARRFNELPAE